MSSNLLSRRRLLQALRVDDERGIALAVAIFALVLVGALVAGTFFVGRVEQQDGRNAVTAMQAFEASEAGLNATVGDWPRGIVNGLGEGDSVSLGTVELGGGNEYSVMVKRLNPTLFFVRSEGARVSVNGGTLATRLLATVVRLDIPQIEVEAALTVLGGLKIGGTAEINGADHVPSGWDATCGPNAGQDTIPGIRTPTPEQLTAGGNCKDLACVTGDPPLLKDSTVTSSTFANFGSTTFDQLASAADLVVGGTINGIGPVLTNTEPARCNYDVISNWGQPYVPGFEQCFDYFPIIYAPGDLHLTGGVGQGILLVRGDLSLSGGVEFYGPVIVLGSVKSSGTGGHVYGGLLARNVELDPTVIIGNSVVNYSECAVRRALRNAASAVPLRERSWAQLF